MRHRPCVPLQRPYSRTTPRPLLSSMPAVQMPCYSASEPTPILPRLCVSPFSLPGQILGFRSPCGGPRGDRRLYPLPTLLLQALAYCPVLLSPPVLSSAVRICQRLAKVLQPLPRTTIGDPTFWTTSGQCDQSVLQGFGHCTHRQPMLAGIVKLGSGCLATFFFFESPSHGAQASLSRGSMPGLNDNHKTLLL